VDETLGMNTRSAARISTTSVGLVLERMPYRENCIIIQGYFPETFDLKGETFCFVNLDMDLYQPTKAALNIFWPLMSSPCRVSDNCRAGGGVILLHDYFSKKFNGIRRAVDEFTFENNISAIPIGDYYSIALVKY